MEDEIETNLNYVVLSRGASICLATYNGAEYLAAQIDSILSQLGSDDELLVSDDGSSDSTVEILGRYGPRLRIVGISRAGGVVKNFERVLGYASRELVVLADQDDVWLPGRLDLIRDSLQKVDLVMTNGEVVDSVLTSAGIDILGFVKFHRGFVKTFVATKYVGCCMAFRRPMLDVLLPFPPHILWHDWYIALAAELFGRVEILQAKTILFRRHAANASVTGQVSGTSLLRKMVSRIWMAYAMLVVTARYVRFGRRWQA